MINMKIEPVSKIKERITWNRSPERDEWEMLYWQHLILSFFGQNTACLLEWDFHFKILEFLLCELVWIKTKKAHQHPTRELFQINSSLVRTI